MTIVSLRPIDEMNWPTAIELEVGDDQDGFVATNAVSLAQSHYEQWWIPLGVYADDEMVGFVMHGRWPDRPIHPGYGEVMPGNDHILRVMIDKQHQGKGYGRAAMIALIERIKAHGDCRAIELSFEPTNVAAEKLYASLGFVRTGRVIDGGGNQNIATVTLTEAATIRAELSHIDNSTQSFGAQLPFAGNNVVYGDDVGVFYLIQLEPDHDPGRFKVGFTTELEGRLRKHRCSAPFAICLKSWPCRRTWERAAIDCVTNGYEQLHTEVFEVFRTSALEHASARADSFFSIMPKLADVSSDGDEPLN